MTIYLSKDYLPKVTHNTRATKLTSNSKKMNEQKLNDKKRNLCIRPTNYRSVDFLKFCGCNLLRITTECMTFFDKNGKPVFYADDNLHLFSFGGNALGYGPI